MIATTNPKGSEALLTVDQAAEYLNCSPWTVRRLISHGQLKASRIGRLIRIRPRDVERAMKPVTRVYAASDKTPLSEASTVAGGERR